MELRNYFDGKKNHAYYYGSNLIGELFLTGCYVTVWGEAKNLDQFLDKLDIANTYSPYKYQLKYVICANDFFSINGLFYTAYLEKKEN